MYKRAQYQTIIKRLKEPRHFRQVVLGPRQVGKTTVVKRFYPYATIVVGEGGMKVEDFLSINPTKLFE